MDEVGDARAVFAGVEVVMTYDQGAGVAPVQILQQSSHGRLLSLGTGVGGLAADIVPALVADAYRVGVVVHAVGTDPPFRSAWLYLSVTTDHVVVADTKPTFFLVPIVNFCGRTRLVGSHCRTMNDDQRNTSHKPMQLVAPSAVSTALAILITNCAQNLKISFFFIIVINSSCCLAGRRHRRCHHLRYCHLRQC